MNTRSMSFLVTGFALATALFVAPRLAFADDAPAPAIGGYDPVAYFTKGEATKGDAAIKTTYLEKLYNFASEDNKKQFDADPEKFLPQYNALCTTALGGTYGNRLPSDPTVFDVRDGKLYLFSQLRAKNAYDRNPAQYIKQADDRFNKPAVGGHCVVTSQKEGKAVKGDPQYKAVYRDWVYHFASAGAKEEFRKSPEKYLPQYDNYCAEGMSRGKAFPTDGEKLRVRNGKTYMLFDKDAETKFDADPDGIIKKADESWPKVKAEKDAEKTKSRQPPPNRPTPPKKNGP